ncbi:uncharacterized protein AC631_04905 [Debaryomyces fabryi]|uniref:CUE domain-containing protein n=1 Tax=Debaryomyces fabryi TaxID=58627 RepID=A0A0V1PT70_9ASCO|nr:uncharacterized protein AC631_04905 [Debaryomyces fabryi]KRZ99332.1 hypothetical protein AC631_04905 [Debaryomyces fabryi]CUM52817.1 unnamed protein product [Debaryomyces fabryi]
MASTDDDSTYIPIPHYPPFKLRSSLIDKDPVIWVHLLEAYIKLFKYLLNPDSHTLKLSVKSQQQLQLFLKIFLFETAEETTKIFSLGAINPDIKTNTAILRTCVFQLIKNYSIVKLSLTGEAIWNFVTIYVKDNSTIVRGLVDGTYKSKFNDNKKSGNISCIGQIHKHLESLISNGKIQDRELNTLSFLLGQHASSATKLKTYTVTGASSNNSRNINKKLTSSLAFAEAFVSTGWIEMLERLYVNGKSVHAEQIKEIMIISLISLSTAKLAKLAMELGVNNTDSLVLYPLFSTIIISDAYKELAPGLEERLTFLRNISFENKSVIKDDIPIKEENIELLADLIPQLTRGQAITILKENNDDVEQVTNILFENPDLISSIEEYEENKKPKHINSESKTESKRPEGQDEPVKRSIYDGDKISNLDFSEGTVIYGKKGQATNNEPATETMKKKTLTAALRLMYESDEDEPDDTYEEQEKTSGLAAGENNKISKRKTNKNRLAVFDEDDGSGADRDTPMTPDRSVSSSPMPASVDSIEKYLFSIFKTKGAEKFDKKDRKSSDRQNIKKSTNWSDEQIEGWLRMLLKSPRRFKILEEDYLYGGNPNRQPARRNNDGDQTTESSNKGNKPKSKEQAKRSFAKNEKNKASKANHNRKSGHSKKTNRELAGMQ